MPRTSYIKKKYNLTHDFPHSHKSTQTDGRVGKTFTKYLFIHALSINIYMYIHVHIPDSSCYTWHRKRKTYDADLKMTEVFKVGTERLQENPLLLVDAEVTSLQFHFVDFWFCHDGSFFDNMFFHIYHKWWPCEYQKQLKYQFKSKTNIYWIYWVINLDGDERKKQKLFKFHSSFLYYRSKKHQSNLYR